MTYLYYVGFNAYKQCPRVDIVLPKIINNWTCFSFKNITDIACTFNKVIIRTDTNFVIHGLVNENYSENCRVIDFPFSPNTFLATDDFLIISKYNEIWRSEYNEKWSLVNIVWNVPNYALLWNKKNIFKMSFMQGNQEIIILLDDGSVWSLHENNKLLLVFSPDLDKATDIVSGFQHTLILTESGCVLSFGNGSRGQLGHGDLNSSIEPLQVLGLGGLKVIKIAAAGWHSCAITDSNDLYMWGWNISGQITEVRDYDLKMESDRYGFSALPMLIDIETNKEVLISDVSCGVRHTIIMTGDGELFATGWNKYGQLGIEDLNVEKICKFIKSNIYLRKNTMIKKLACGPWSSMIFGKEDQNED